MRIRFLKQVLQMPRALLLLGVAFTQCCAITQTVAKPQCAADRGLILTGTVVTLNDQGDVWPNARLWIRNGRIEAIAPQGELLPTDSRDSLEVETQGVIYPGLIDLHNHPEYAHFPLLPVARAYKDRYEWRWYDDDYNRRITVAQAVLTGNGFYNLGLEVGRYGEIKALVGGTTTLQGARPLQPYAKAECLVRNVETSPATGAAFSHVDLGRDADDWKKFQDENRQGVVVIHLAEGPSARMSEEFRAIKQSGLLNANLVAVHGVGLTEAQLQEMAAAKASLVWSPLSNFLLYGKTANVAAAKRAGVAISLAPDWAPSGSKSVLGELKVADLVNRQWPQPLFSDKELVEMVTRRPAEALHWGHQLGRIAPGFLADLVVVDKRQDDVYRNLIEATEEQIRLVVVRGSALYGDAALMQKASCATDLEAVSPRDAARKKWLAPNCPGSDLPAQRLADTMDRLQTALGFSPEFTASKVPVDTFVRELAQCNQPKPDDPPSIEDARRLLDCRFGTKPEAVELSPLTTAADPGWFKRLLANPNVPGYLKKLPDYYR